MLELELIFKNASKPKQIQTIKSQGERVVLPAQRDAVYLVKTAGRTFKVIL